MFIVASVVGLAACGVKTDDRKGGPPATLITVISATAKTLEITEETVGTLESLIDPKVGAEVAGRVAKVLVGSGKAVKQGELLALIADSDFRIQRRADDADLKRLESLLAQQEKVVERQRQLVQRNFISQNALDEVTAQRDAQREQLAAASARVDAGKSSLDKTRVVSPVDGYVEVQMVSAGDYVKVGDPLFQIVSNRKLRAHLPFPESAAIRMRRGLPVRISSPQLAGKEILSTIDELKPSISQTSRSIDVIVTLEDAQGFRGGGTVNGAVVVATRAGTIMLPEQSVVLRPAGKVVYVVKDGKAEQRMVEVGIKKGGLLEIVSGLREGEAIALDGAGFLTDKASVAIKDSETAGGRKAAEQTPLARPKS
jgi:RND family efflux transporter MFP subunit